MRRAVHEALRIRFGFRCGYCGVAESEAGSELTVDHFQPTSHGGSDEPENLVYCCHACNEFKHDYWSEREERRLLHPERDDISVHLTATPEGALLARTPRGELHLRVLRLNRVPLIQRRLEFQQREQEREEKRNIQAKLQDVEVRIARLEAWIRENE